ncbi:hypothetical protein PSHT_14654 [Puccinia striiformis]|uniref:C2H2-type domain-containing protein n=1 Tax=Puccinia striiformis TaxID=27350 RepID=A0A2S4UJA3_9BASI|nr:hypothetical protein PSHT_14654 [Puccinia striiformis]
MKPSYPFTSSTGVSPLSRKAGVNTGTTNAGQTVTIGPLLPNSLPATPPPLSSTIQTDCIQPNLEFKLQPAKTSSSLAFLCFQRGLLNLLTEILFHSCYLPFDCGIQLPRSKQAFPQPLSSSFSNHASSTVTGEVHSAQSLNHYVCHGSLALGTYSRKPIIPTSSMHPVSRTPSVPVHSGSVMGLSDVDMPSYFGNIPSTSAFGDRDTRSRHAPARQTVFSATSTPPPMGVSGALRQSNDFFAPVRSDENFSSFMELNSCPQTNEEWIFTNPFGSVVRENSPLKYHTGRGGRVDPLLSETLAKSNSDLLSFIASNFPAGENFTPSHEQVRATTNPSLADIKSSTGLSDLSWTSAIGLSKPTTSTQIDSREDYPDTKFLNFNTFENCGNEPLKFTDTSKALLKEEDADLTNYASSTASNSSSHSSSPSLSSSSTPNSRSPSYSPCHSSIDLISSNETSAFAHTTNTHFAKDFGAHAYFGGSQEGILDVGTQPPPLNPMPDEGQSELGSFYPFQHHIERQQQLFLQQIQLQQSWPHGTQLQTSWSQVPRPDLPQIDNFGIAPRYQDGNSHYHTPPALKPMFFCPKCGKGHTRQSNLLAHLRDTHSQVKKELTLSLPLYFGTEKNSTPTVFCDVPGCTKSYKRVSECRRHKKDCHGIPLPSELSGKVRKPRSTFSSILRSAKYQNC